MTPEALVEALDRFQVPKQRLARHLGVNQRTVSRWCAGEAGIPASVPWVLAAYLAWPWTRRLRGQMPVRFEEWFTAPCLDRDPANVPALALLLADTAGS